MFQDLRFALRTFLKSPGFTMVALCAIALGIGANTAIFSLVNVVLLRPLPVQAPERLMYVFSGRDPNPVSSSSYPDFVDLKTQNTAFSDLLAYSGVQLRMAMGDQVEVVQGLIVTGNYFDVLGVKPTLGRTFSPDEDRDPMANAVAVLQHGFWTRRFGADPGIIGQSVTLNGRAFTVIGVAPPGFMSIDVTNDAQIYVPMMMQELVRPPRGGFAGGDAKLLDKRGSKWLTMVGRLKPGISPVQAQSNLSAIAKQLEQAYPATNRALLATVMPAAVGRPGLRESLVPVAALLMAVVGAVLLIACANVANLMLARVSVRRREIAVRLSLGASRSRLIRQLLTESMLMSLLGGTIGLLVANWGLRLLLSLGQIQTLLPVHLEISPDARILGFTFLLSIATGLFFGLAPALRSFRFDVVGDLKNETGAIRHGRLFGLRNVLVIGQMAVSLVLLMGAGLFLRSFLAAQSVDIGVDTSKLITMPMNVNLLAYNRQQSTDFYRQAIERVQALPGVESVSMARVLVLSGSNRSYSYYADGTIPEPDSRGTQVSGNVVGLNFFRTVGTPLVKGRDFSEQDREGTPLVAVINEALAQAVWPGQDPIGKQLQFSAADKREIIGVVRDAKYLSIQEPSRPYVYLPLLQNFETGMTLHVRVKANPETMLVPVRAAVQSIDRNLPLIDVHTMSENVGASLLPARLGVWLIGGFAGLALLLAAIGTYGVMSYTVAQRTREIGIRMALGARQSDVTTLIVGQGMTLALIGLGIGLAASFALTRLIGSMLFGVSPTDPLTFVSVAGILGAVALVASYLPARRAARVDPLIAVRQE